MSPTRRWFGAVAFAEGLSLVALFGIAMPLKYVAGNPEPVAWVGMAHGILFLVYCIALGSVARVDGWSVNRSMVGFAASMVPLGTFALEAWLRKVEAPVPARASSQ